MGFSLIPDMRIDSIFEITPEMLVSRGISLLLLDLDNTLAPYSGDPPSKELFLWKDKLEAAGIQLFIVSNTKTGRARRFAESFGVAFTDRAKKPSRKGILRAIESCGKTAKQTALAGDQIFTDILGANKSGIVSIVVKPLKFLNPLMALRYYIEIPFRLLRKREAE